MNSNPYYQPYWDPSDELEHFGIKGMKWGIRRYQNLDGSLTEAGKERYADKIERLRAKEHKNKDRASKTFLESVNRAIEKHPDTKFFQAEKNQLAKFVEEETKAINSMTDKELLKRSHGRKVGYTAAAITEIASLGSIATAIASVSAGAASLTPPGVAAAGALGGMWVIGSLGGVLIASVTAEKYDGDTSDYTKNIKKGNQWIGGKTFEYGASEIAKGEEEARKTGKRDFSVTRSTANGWATLTVPISLIDKYVDV